MVVLKEMAICYRGNEVKGNLLCNVKGFHEWQILTIVVTSLMTTNVTEIIFQAKKW
jgi:hypothetical protein